MITQIKDNTFVVLGLGRSGMAAVDWLCGKGAQVIALDDAEKHVHQAIEKGALPIPMDQIDWSCVTALVQSPGIDFYPHPHPVTKTAQAHQVPVIGDCHLLRQAYPDAQFVGITGTNGKSTTTALVGHILQSAKRTVAVGGNIGVAALSLPALGHGEIYVLELSSYQLDLCPDLDLDIAALINLTPDHLDRHGNIENYVKAKEKIFATTSASQVKICGVDDDLSRQICQKMSLNNPPICVSASADPIEGMRKNIYIDQFSLIDSTYGEPVAILDLQTLNRLRGRHNHQNIAMAYAICQSLGVSMTEIVDGISSFPGLVHRQEWVAEIEGVQFINDSKATNADATSHALETYDDVYWIVGGKDKTDGIAELAPYFSKIKQAFLIGAAANRFAQTLKGHVTTIHSGDLETAVQQAFLEAKKNKNDDVGNDKTRAKKPVILLSPACASYDQFRDFEHRGDCFKNAVSALKARIL